MKFKIVILSAAFFSLFCNRHGKNVITKDEVNVERCNRDVYGTVRYIDSLPQYICIPDGYIFDDYVRISDLDHDRFNDFLALKYNRKEDDQEDGEKTFWSFYYRNKKDTIYRLGSTLENIVPPFIKHTKYEYLMGHPLAEEILENYPNRLLGHDLSFRVSKDTIRLAYKFEDTYGKSFVFVYNASNWYLENIEYFIGELPMYWWDDNEFYYPLNDTLRVIETRKPKRRVPINEFDLKVAFKYREDQWVHLSDWHISRIDKSKWKNILDVVFEPCRGMDLPDDWEY